MNATIKAKAEKLMAEARNRIDATEAFFAAGDYDAASQAAERAHECMVGVAEMCGAAFVDGETETAMAVAEGVYDY